MSEKNKENQAPVTLAEQAFADFQKQGAVENVSSRHVEWKEPGQRVVGWLRQVKKLKSQEAAGGDYCQYVLDDGVELITVICGAQVDQMLADGKRIGQLLEIVFKGKERIGRGRTMNTFLVRTAKGADAQG